MHATIFILLYFFIIFLVAYMAYASSRDYQESEFKQLKQLMEDQTALQTEAFLASKAMITEAFGQPTFTAEAQEVEWHDA